MTRGRVSVVVPIALCACLLMCLHGSSGLVSSDEERPHGEYARALGLLDQGRNDEAERAARGLLARIEASGNADSLEAADALDILVRALWRRGTGYRLTELLELAQRAVRIKESVGRVDSPDFALSLNNHAAVLVAGGNYRAARTLFERVIAIRRKTLGPGHPDVGRVLHNLGVMNIYLGDYSAGRRYLEGALALLQDALGADHWDLSYILFGLGDLLETMGDYQGALSHYERVRSMQERRPEGPHLAGTLAQIGTLLRRMGRDTEARPLYERALRIWEKERGKTHRDTAYGLYLLGSLLLECGEVAAAKPLIEQSLEIREKVLPPDHPDIASGSILLARLVMSSPRRARACPLYERAMKIRQSAYGADHPELVEALIGYSALRWALGDVNQAVGTSLRAESLARMHFQRTAQTLPESQALRYGEVRVTGLDLALSMLAEARLHGPGPGWVAGIWDEVVRSRALVLDEMAGRNRQSPDGLEMADLASELNAARNRLARIVAEVPEPGGFEAYQAQIRQAEQDKERAECTLAEHSASFRRSLGRRRIGLQDVMSALPASSALVAYVRYQRASGPVTGTAGTASYLALTAGPGGENLSFVPLGPAHEIDSLIDRWRSAAAPAPQGLAARREGDGRSLEAGKVLRRAIWDPLPEQIRGAARVFLVPEGNLHLVNMAALPLEEGGYLLENGPLIHHLSTERDVVLAGAGGKAGRGLLVLGGPDFDRNPVGLAARRSQRRASGETVFGPEASPCSDLAPLHFRPIPAAAVEGREVAHLWESAGGGARDGEAVVKLLGREATAAAFKSLAPGRRIVHLATHGFFARTGCAGNRDRNAAAPLQRSPFLVSGLALAGANERVNGDPDTEVEDGILLAEEIASLDLSDVEWVVLSACETGLGKIQAGEGVIGLRRAFELAGAGTLIMSLWPIDDQTTRFWMRALYETRFEGLSTAECVRAASLKTLRARRAAGQSTHPFFWGGFVATGDWK